MSTQDYAAVGWVPALFSTPNLHILLCVSQSNAHYCLFLFAHFDRPPTDTTVLNFNLFNAPTFERLAKYAMTTQNSAISPVLNTETMFGAAAPQSGDHPQSIMVHPVAREFATSANNPIVGHTIAVITWKGLLEDLLPPGQPPVTVVLKESCGAAFTYRVDGPIAVFLGLGDLHDPAYNHLGESSDFLHNNDESTSQGMSTDTTEAVLQDHCEYTIGVYPTSEYEEFFQTPQPVIFTVAVILIFAFSAAVFIAYSCLVDRRQEKVHETAVQAKNIVNSLFPGQVAEQLQAERARKAVAWTTEALTEESEIVEHNQLAEFYPSVTIMVCENKSPSLDRMESRRPLTSSSIVCRYFRVYRLV